jgi:hypothetical protein
MNEPELPPPVPQPRIECRCAGDPHEMGFAQGQAIGPRIHALRRSLPDLEAFRLEQPWWLPFPMFLKLAEAKAAKLLVPALSQLNPGAFARLEGIAEGAGAPLNSLCLMNSLEALLSSVSGRTVASPVAACSALAIRGARSFNGQPIIARNFDYIEWAHPCQILRESRPQAGFRSLEFLMAPQAGAADGMNEKGLCITMNYAFVMDAGTPAPLITMAIAEALACCATVAEALDLISRRTRWGAGMLMLADASGDIASLELTNTRSAHRRPPLGEDWLVHTNVCKCAETRAVQVPDAHVYGENVPRSLRGQRVLKCHADRADRIEKLLRQTPKAGPDELAAIMADHGPNGTPDSSSPCVHSDYFRTTACLQWFPAERRVRVSFANPCVADYVELAL